MFAELRESVSEDLQAEQLRTATYVGEALEPPVAVVVPAQPYIVYPGQTQRDVPFGHVLIRLDVLLVAGQESAKGVADRIDQMTEAALRGLRDRDVVRVTRPGLTKLRRNGPELVAAAVTIEEVTEEPS